MFTDVPSKHRQYVDRGESSPKAKSSKMSPTLSSCLECFPSSEDGGVGLPVYITVVFI